MPTGLLAVSYIGASILFILSLGGLSHQKTARRGNLYGISGMAVAIVATGMARDVTGLRNSDSGDPGRWSDRRGGCPARRDDRHATTRRHAEQPGRAGGRAGGDRQPFKSAHGLESRRASHFGRGDLSQRPDRHRDLYRLGDRLRQTAGPALRAPAIAARTQRNEHHRPVDPALAGL